MAGPYDTIREAAMNPGAGGAAGYEAMLWDQMVGANQQESDAYLQSLRDTSNRALQRSGWYNVGSMLMPQDAGDVALSAAMGPGLGRLSRAALAGLGGMTTQPGEAEGAFLPREMFRRLRGHPAVAARREADRGAGAIADAERNSGTSSTDLKIWGDQDLNEAFDDLVQAGAPYGAIPTEAGWAALLDPTRPLRLQPRLTQDIGDMLRSPQISNITRPQSQYRFDPWLESAIGVGNDPLVRLERSAAERGHYRPIDDSIMLAPQGPRSLAETFDHELQHRVQRFTTDRTRTGASPAHVANRNSPELWQEYLTRARGPEEEVFGWTAVSGGLTPEDAIQAAQRNMYMNNFGEWEARLAAQATEAGQYPQRFGGYPGESWLEPYRRLIDAMHETGNPDFRIR